MKPTSLGHVRFQHAQPRLRVRALRDHLWGPKHLGGHGFPVTRRPDEGRRTLAWLITQHSNRHREEGPHR